MKPEFITTVHRNDQDRTAKSIRTFTGRYVNPLAMCPEDVCIEDIAHHLSLICRYTGACPHHYSVAQHSVLVAKFIYHNPLPDMVEAVGITAAQFALAGLLHDAAEYVFNDIASPVKHDPRMKWYVDLEHETTRMIFTKFGIDPCLLPLTKGADNWVFKAEVGTWYGDMDFVNKWSPAVAEHRFLKLFNELRAQL